MICNDCNTVIQHDVEGRVYSCLCDCHADGTEHNELSILTQEAIDDYSGIPTNQLDVMLDEHFEWQWEVDNGR